MPVSEIDGRDLDACGEAWRAECEASFVLSMPTRAHRYRYLYGAEHRSKVVRTNPETGEDEIRINPKTGRPVALQHSVLKARGLAAADALMELAKNLHQARTQRAQREA